MRVRHPLIPFSSLTAVYNSTRKLNYLKIGRGRMHSDEEKGLESSSIPWAKRVWQLLQSCLTGWWGQKDGEENPSGPSLAPCGSQEREGR